MIETLSGLEIGNDDEEFLESDFKIPDKVCEVCGTHVLIKKSGTCVQRPMIGETSYWDYMDCPRCGCQILLKRRYLDICKNIKVEGE